ncbi:tetratricopeptide repeat protein [Pontibacter sp. G13]|uniref:tetratricopeptide repeat protein n=1 Tax=Pontibacter sp. G13 TaxID=3074898 RepID=UPI00288AC70B|nr:tetratricopeptide repeat protein [Pontibacter sp. G13]WNJ21024.1 tetratricopeptide repeat protein [Pontibacter sp. G13]
MKHLLPVILILLMAGAGCRSTQKAFQRGNYEKAVFNSIERLRRSPNNVKSRETLREAYPAMVDYINDRVISAKQSPDPFKWESIMRYYRTLNRAYDELQRAPAALEVVYDPRNYETEYNQAVYNAADARYAVARQDLDRGKAGDRESAKNAYRNFERALAIRPNFKDAIDLKAEALDYATLIIQIEPIPMHSQSLALTNEFFENQLYEYIASAGFNQFILFVSGKESEVARRNPDQVIQMVFDEFQVGDAFVKETVFNRKKDSVVVGQVEVNDSLYDAYGTVEAEVHSFTKTITSDGLLDLRIIDNRTGAILSQRKFPGSYAWTDSWGYYKGDDKALSEEDEKICSKDKESPNPDAQFLFVEFTKPIFTQVTSFVKEYYRSY